MNTNNFSMDEDTPNSNADQIAGTIHPRLNSCLYGHSKPMNNFLKAFNSGTMHHAWLICGQRGVGKATFCWHVIKYIMISKDDVVEQSLSLTDINSDQIDKIHALTNPRVYLCRRSYDEKLKRFKKFISVDDIRGLKSYFSMAETEGNWKIALVDSADELNNAASNALLKLLEEPPKKVLFLLIAHQPSKLLDTIRSRCRLLRLMPLHSEDWEQALKLSNVSTDNLSESEKEILNIMSEGSVGYAIQIINNNGLKIYNYCVNIISTYPCLDRSKIYHLLKFNADRNATLHFITSIILFCINRLAKLLINPEHSFITNDEKLVIEKLNRINNASYLLAVLHQEITLTFDQAHSLNLDLKQQILSSFLKLEEKLKTHDTNR